MFLGVAWGLWTGVVISVLFLFPACFAEAVSGAESWCLLCRFLLIPGILLDPVTYGIVLPKWVPEVSKWRVALCYPFLGWEGDEKECNRSCLPAVCSLYSQHVFVYPQWYFVGFLMVCARFAFQGVKIVVNCLFTGDNNFKIHLRERIISWKNYLDKIISRFSLPWISVSQCFSR